MHRADVAIIGAGAAGLMTAIWAGRRARSRSTERRVVLLDGAARIGAKILVSGGGRCNVTHDVVDERAFAGSSRHAIRKVLRAYTAEQTVAFFAELGVTLKHEETGKLFPTTDDASTVLEALLREVDRLGVALEPAHRVEAIERDGGGFRISGPWGEVAADRVVLATGGKSLPKTGSDGFGYHLAKSLGHSITPRIFPALVPLRLPEGHFIRTLSGLTVPATLEVRTASGKSLVSFTDSTLCTHFGLSGPSVLDVSRYYLDARADDAQTQLVINWLPHTSREEIDHVLQARDGRSVSAVLRGLLPERLARVLCERAKIDPALPVSRLAREARRSLVQCLTALPLPIIGDKGFAVAEVTAGGVPLSEINLNSMESRVCPGLFIAGEICDVDGRIGGYNFQWAWSSGYVAGNSV